MKRIVLASLLGTCLGLLGMAAYETGRYVVRSEPPSEASVPRELAAFQVDPSWILSGQPVFRATETTRSPDGRTITGLWSCEGPTTFVWTFSLDETVHLIEGEVDIEYLGKRFTLRPGDTATFHAGTQATWRIDRYAKKSYTLHHPGRLGLLWRKLFPSDEG